MQHTMLSHFFLFILPNKRLWFVKYMCICVYPTAYKLYMNYRSYEIILRVEHFYTNRERCEVLTGSLSLGRWRDVYCVSA